MGARRLPRHTFSRQRSGWRSLAIGELARYDGDFVAFRPLKKATAALGQVIFYIGSAEGHARFVDEVEISLHAGSDHTLILQTGRSAVSDVSRRRRARSRCESRDQNALLTFLKTLNQPRELHAWVRRHLRTDRAFHSRNTRSTLQSDNSNRKYVSYLATSRLRESAHDQPRPNAIGARGRVTRRRFKPPV